MLTKKRCSNFCPWIQSSFSVLPRWYHDTRVQVVNRKSFGELCESLRHGLWRKHDGLSEEWSEREQQEGSDQGYGFRRVAALRRRIRFLSEDPLPSDDPVRLLRCVGVLLADFHHADTGWLLVLGAGTREPHCRRKVRTLFCLLIHF